MNGRDIAAAATLVLMVTACSSRPREFVPTLAAPPAEQVSYDAVEDTCRTLVRQGQRSGFAARLASGGVGVAGVGAGLAVGAGVGAATLGSGAGMAAAGAAISTALVAIPVLGIGAAWGYAKARKTKKEREFKAAMGLCLSEGGYPVSAWRVANRRERRSGR